MKRRRVSSGPVRCSPRLCRGRPLLPPEPPSRPNSSPDRWKGLAEPGGKVWEGLDAIAATDPTFSGKGFVEGARKAYEMIVTAFAKGDRDTLHNLLSKDVFDSFAREIDGREKRGEKAEFALVSIDEAVI